MSRSFAVGFAALFSGGMAAADVPPPPPPPPPTVPASSSAAAAGGLVTSMGLDQLKAVFDSAGVAYTVQAYGDGFPYLSAQPEGFQMYVTLIDCPQKGQPVDCASVAIESGSWSKVVTLADVNYFNRGFSYVRAVIQDTEKGFPSLTYSFSLSEGVSPVYVRGQLKTFVAYMKYFGAFEWLPKPAASADAGGPAAVPGGFSMPTDLPTLAGGRAVPGDTGPAARR